MSDLINMSYSWAQLPTTTGQQPQQRTVPTWGAVGSPAFPLARPNPNTPSSAARRIVQLAGLGGLGGLAAGEGDTVVVVRERWWVFGVVTLVSGGVSAYHGYKRNRRNVAWGAIWGLAGVVFPIITVVVAGVQGYAKPKGS